MATSLTQALAYASPRLSPRRTPVISLLIHGGVLALWLVLFARAFALGGVLAWSVGIAYIAYDTALLIFVAWACWPILRPSSQPADPAEAGRLSLGVIIAAHNEVAALPVTLNALLAQADLPDQIVIADDGSTDGSAELLTETYGFVAPALGEVSPPSPHYPAIRWLRLPHRGKAVALNAAITQLDTEIILTVDADTLLAPDAIGAMRAAFTGERSLVAATGILVPLCARSVSGRFFQWFQTYEYIRNFIARFAWMGRDSLLLISGAFAGFRRDALLTVGGFDPAFVVEDYELIHRLHRYSVDHGLGWRVRVLGSARATTDAPATLGSFLRQRRRWFAGFLQTQYWNRDMTGNSRYGQLGTMMLPVKAFDTLQPIYGLTAFALLLAFLGTGKAGIIVPVLAVIGAKILIDLVFHLWSVHIYRRWTGDRTSSHIGYAILATLAEPFSFQLLRHIGAAWGWLYFLTRRRAWS